MGEFVAAFGFNIAQGDLTGKAFTAASAGEVALVRTESASGVR